MQCPWQHPHPTALALSRQVASEAVPASTNTLRGRGEAAALRLVEHGHPERRGWTWSPGCHCPREGVLWVLRAGQVHPREDLLPAWHSHALGPSLPPRLLMPSAPPTPGRWRPGQFTEPLQVCGAGSAP